MKRQVSAGTRLLVSGGVFCLAFLGAVTGSYCVASALNAMRYEAVTIVFALLIWGVLAYFPARQIYGWLTYRVIAECLHCEQCGYDLTGNESARCPECGRAIQTLEVLRQVERARTVRQRSPGGWRWPVRRMIGAGVCLSLALAASITLWQLDRNTRYTLPEDFERTPSPLDFVRWNRQSEVAKVDPNSVFGLRNGEVQLRLTFNSARHRVLESVGVSDSAGRAWLDIDLLNRRYSVNQYEPKDTGSSSQPRVTLSDTNGDGLVDRRSDWFEETIWCLEGQPSWASCDAHDESGP